MSCGDIKRHSEGIWRSFFIFNDCPTMLIREYLDRKQYLFSYCNYGKTETEDKHVTFRINFYNNNELLAFRRFLKGLIGTDSGHYLFSYKEKNYDEEYNTKLAYCAGTALYETFLDYIHQANMPIDQEQFNMLMIHGFFNNMHFTKGEEFEFWFWMAKKFLSEFGFKV